jgi:hybrid polyketide synthase/nonribosomal peptide synthetase ACE1
VPFYTYTDPSSDAVKIAAESFSMYNVNMSFKVLDTEQAPAAQGYEPQSYDVVLASNFLHATASLQKILENARQLLKPGGYLVLLGPTDNNPARFTTILGHLPGWWHGVRDIKEFAPTLTPKVLHSALRKAGFGGIDTITPDLAGSAWPVSVMTAQAVDDQILFLRRPLSSPSPHVYINSLVILGTGSLETSHIAAEVSEILAPFCGSIDILDDLPTQIEAMNLDPTSTFINLVDLYLPTFKAMTNGKMEGLKRLFQLARHILWLTRNVQLGEEPYHAASLSFCRSLSNEATHISVNTLDISGMDENVPKVIAEQLLRQCALEEWDQQQLLWSKEPETYLHHGRLLIPRIEPCIDQNARLNASRRVITKTVPVSTPNISIVSGGADSPLHRLEESLPSHKSRDEKMEMVSVTSSSLMALHVTPDAFLFIAIGETDGSAQPVITASTTNSRTIAPIVTISAVEFGDTVNANRILLAIISELLAAALFQKLAPKSSILVHCSGKDHFFAASLSRQAAAKDVRVSFSCPADDANDLDPFWISLDAHASRHIMRRKLLHVQPTHFLDLTARSSTGKHHNSGISSNLVKILPSGCREMDPRDFSQHEAFVPRSFNREQLVSQLEDAAVGARTTIFAAFKSWGGGVREPILELDQVYDNSATRQATSVVHWRMDGKVQVQVPPVNGQNLFSQDKTYVLFGLSGQVGQSLCEWMVSNGARCVCLTSRRPNVDPRWLESFQATQATVKILAADITDRNSLEDILRTIRATCPPIAGVVNGANVPSDAPFDGMSSDTMLQALRPKIDGSYNLDQAFYNVNLDFFVLFSSISSVIGTSGQSNYTAANGYMNGLARQRRRRGLAASAIDIGLILGIGLAEGAGQHVVDSLQKYAITPLCEPDVRLAFAESIRFGYSNSKDKDPGTMPAAVMTSGLRTITSDETDIVWHKNPMFSHLVMNANSNDSAGDKSRNKTAALPIKDQISAAVSKEAAFEILKGK